MDHNHKIITEAAQIYRIDQSLSARATMYSEPLDTDSVARWIVAAIIAIGAGIIIGGFVYAALANWTATVDQAAMMGKW